MGKGNQKKLQSSRPSYPSRPLSRWKGGTAEQKRRGVEAVLFPWPPFQSGKGEQGEQKNCGVVRSYPPFPEWKGGAEFFAGDPLVRSGRAEQVAAERCVADRHVADHVDQRRLARLER